MAKKKIYGRSYRLREILKLLLRKNNERCYFCKGVFVDLDKITIHHIDFNHENNDLSNLALCHRECHKGYHLMVNRGLKSVR